MIKYVDTLVTFSEVPNEISLCIDVSGCKIHCKGCHSSYLWEDIGVPLTLKSLDDLIMSNIGITCVCLMGGNDYAMIVRIARKVKRFYRLAFAWYTGEDTLNPYILGNLVYFDYIKIGHYDDEKGPLMSMETNQVFYKVIEGELVENTCLFWKNKTEGNP